MVCGVATWQLWPDTLAFQTPATLLAVRSGAPAGAVPSGGSEATWVPCGAVGNFDGSAVPGDAGGGSWFAVTLPEGAACSGAGCWSIDENRDVEQPLAKSAASDTASRPVFEKSISNLRRVRPGCRPHNIPFTKTEKVAKFQPNMVKIAFAAAPVATLPQMRAA
ncbi:hypothetical protein MES5069_150038 [Mesorhizobium escarrei]|uniref:Uncharacterized protein n=1 Tax=Mesorhizobium escarrei TaxID=666018 RepID=A0ABM9DLN6_9HYPH|nr:hypothetical protein MES5069_150038 [Mesorhizobium escarrei]